METLIKLRIAGFVVMATIIFVTHHACGDGSSRGNQSENEDFLIEAASSNSMEIAAGGLATSNGQHEAVRAFGQQMVDEHTAVQNEMSELANSKGWTVPTELLRKHERELERLRNQTGEDFDREFAELMVRSHEDAIDLFTDFAESGDNDPDRRIDQDLRNFASQKVPDLRAHLDHANRLLDSVRNRRDGRDSTLMMQDSLGRSMPTDPMN